MKIVRGIGSLLYTLAIYVGLPLVGWGLDDVGGFFSHSQLLVYSATIALFGALIGYQVSRSKEALRGGKEPDSSRGRESCVLSSRPCCWVRWFSCPLRTAAGCVS